MLKGERRYLSDCAPTPPLNQQKSTDTGRGRYAVARILTLIQAFLSTFD